MAWIVKNSAQMHVDQRDQPYLDEAMQADLEANIIPRYPTRQASTLPVLHAIQHKHGWIPAQALQEAADFLGLTASQVMDTATFYEEFWLKPKGKYLIMICQSLTCEMMGHEDLLEKIQLKLGVQPGQTTDDGRFTLMTAQCLGSCGTAPCALVNEDLRESLTLQTFEQYLDQLD